jgi:PKD repeat protein
MVSRRQGSRVLTAIVAVVAVCAWAAAGAVRVDVLSSAKDAAPGEVVTHVFAVSHDGTTEETFALAVDAPAGWSVLGVQPQIVVQPAEEGVVFVTLTVPADAAAGSYSVTLRATSTVDPTDEATAGIATRVSAVNQVEITPPDAQGLSPGESAAYSVIVTNRGNAQDVLTLVAESSRGFSVSISVSSLELSPRESRELLVTLSVPVDAVSGRDVLTVKAASTLYAGVEDEIAIFTTILPPGPEAANGALYETLPTQIALEIERDEMTGAFDSRFSLAMSGAILDGTFAASFTALHPFGTVPVDVTAYSVSYRLDRSSFALGTVSQTLTDLQSISCDGGSTEIDGTFVGVGLIAGGSDDETRFGGRLVFGPGEARVGVTYTDCRAELTQSSAWTGIARVEPLDGWVLRAEGGFGTVNGKRGPAGFVGTSVEGETFFLSADAFSADTYFPGPRNDAAGIEASQRLLLSAMTLGLSFAHTWNNVVRNPLAPTLVADSLGMNVSATPWDPGPTLQATVTLDRELQEDGTPRDDVDALLAYHVADAQGSFPYAFSGQIDDRLDLLLGTRERTVTHTQEVGISIDELAVTLTLTEEQVVDLVHDVVLSSAASAALVVRPGGAPHEASIEFESAGDQLTLGASFVLHVTDDLSVSLDGSAEWERGGAARFGWSAEFEATFGIPLPFFVTKGRIRGHAFVDQNANGIRDAGEPPAAGVVVFVEESEVSTDAEGAYRFPPLAPRRYTLEVRALPRNAAFGDPLVVDVIAGAEETVDVPLVPVLSLSGAVFNDANQDGARQPQETGFSGIRVILTRADGSTLSTSTDAQGEFAFTNTRPETYVVTLDSTTLPERFSFTTPESQIVDAASGVPVLFGGFIRPRQVVVTFQPPTADGTYAPAAPRAGEVVTFDASASFDFDGAIVATAWDFDADGSADSADVVASHVFAAQGDYSITLTVTDDAGNTDTQILEVHVAAPAVSPSTPTTPPRSTATRPPVADFSYTPVAPFAGQEVTFSAASSVDFDGAIARFSWDFNGDGNSDAEGIAAQWVFSAAGSHDVALTVTDAAGMTDTVVYSLDVVAATQPVPVSPPASTSPGGPSARFSFSPTVASAGEAVRFDASASASPSGGNLEYAWDFDGNGTTDGDGPTSEWVFDTPGATPVTLTVTASDGRSDSLTLSVPVTPVGSGTRGGQPPVAALQYIPVSPHAGEPVLFSATASTDFDGRVVAYAWDFNADGLFESTAAIAEHTFSEAGTFRVRLTVVDDAGMTDSVDATLTVL